MYTQVKPLAHRGFHMTYRHLYANVIQIMEADMSTSVVSVRVNAVERDLLEAAADSAKTNLSDFIRRKAVEAAEESLMERRVIELSPKDWEKFEAQMQAPPRRIEAITAMMERTRAWRE
jgi:uncharacterized protein (DUF1778 family)